VAASVYGESLTYVRDDKRGKLEMADNELAADASTDRLGDAQRREAVNDDEGEHGKRIAEEVSRKLGVKVEYVRLE
jgi:hypothetical protein